VLQTWEELAMGNPVAVRSVTPFDLVDYRPCRATILGPGLRVAVYRPYAYWWPEMRTWVAEDAGMLYILRPALVWGHYEPILTWKRLDSHRQTAESVVDGRRKLLTLGAARRASARYLQDARSDAEGSGHG
jgi:hypothetical protein